jgi:hypothetical protein
VFEGALARHRYFFEPRVFYGFLGRHAMPSMGLELVFHCEQTSVFLCEMNGESCNGGSFETTPLPRVKELALTEKRSERSNSIRFHLQLTAKLTT